MSAKPRLLLLDSVVVLEAMRQAKWVPLCKHYHVILPSIVVGVELKYFVDMAGAHHELVLEPVPGSPNQRFRTLTMGLKTPDADCPVWAGEFAVWEAAPLDYQQTGEMLHSDLSGMVHDGEREAVTYLRLIDDEETTYFVTADAGAIKAAVAFERTENLLCLQDVLTKCGHTVAKLEEHFQSAFLKKAIHAGQAMKIQGRARAPIPKAGKRK